MKYRIRKSDVIKAIASEPLLAKGAFFRDIEANWPADKDDKSCAVCAVGAVMRAVSPGNFSHDDGFKLTGEDLAGYQELHRAWEHNNFFAILSTEYESVVWSPEHYEDYDLARFHAIMVAEGMCPETLEFEV